MNFLDYNLQIKTFFSMTEKKKFHKYLINSIYLVWQCSLFWLISAIEWTCLSILFFNSLFQKIILKVSRISKTFYIFLGQNSQKFN